MGEAKSGIPEDIDCHQLSSGEQEIVESYARRIVFTDGTAFDSSELINAHMAIPGTISRTAETWFRHLAS